jgi:hypothetical protein
MKRLLAPLLLLLISSAAIPAVGEQMIPAGSVLQCLVADTISSKTTRVGDPILCTVSHSELYGRSTFPFGSYLEGHFEAYKDPGHFVGKGWMELKFDRMVVGNDTVIPIETRVIATSGKNAVTGDGRILGTGHAVRDTVEWMIPVLWPIDLINLPRRGPTPVLKPETRLTVKVLDDFGIPTKAEVQHQPELISRYNYADPAPCSSRLPRSRNRIMRRSGSRIRRQPRRWWWCSRRRRCMRIRRRTTPILRPRRMATIRRHLRMRTRTRRWRMGDTTGRTSGDLAA